ncbi:alpha/beta fold hydrolase [Microbacterium sp. YY-01]|uniref:alpha/beta fold hydrolase n=1 Tax=Microbacterium sp. YY-01 TaxID=3421634 RepID=UPI003D1849D3
MATIVAVTVTQASGRVTNVQPSSDPAASPVLFLHGGGVSCWMWRPLTGFLDPSITPVMLDLPGHGARAHETYRSHDSTTHELAQWIRAAHPDGVHVVGFSLGAQLALSLASSFPQLVKSAVIVSGETIPTRMPRATLALIKIFLPLARFRWFARAQAQALAVPAALIDEYVRDSGRLSSETVVNSVGENIRFVIPDGWSAYPGAVRVVVGEKERGLMVRSARATHEAAKNSRLVVVPGSAHDIPFTNPQVLSTIICEVARPVR